MNYASTVYFVSIIIWYIELFSSAHLLKNQTPLAMLPSNRSKYAYEVHRGSHSDAGSTPSYYDAKARTSEPTPTQINCSVSDAEDFGILEFTQYSRDYSTPNISVLSEEFLNCTHTNVEPGCYQMLPNGSVYVPLYRRIFDEANYNIRNGLLFICPDFFDQMEDKYSSSIRIISVVGVSISSLCIVLHMVMFSLIERMRNLPGYCLLSLCISLLISYSVFIVQIIASRKQANCKVIGLFMMYSLHASFFWMNVISFDVWHTIRLATSKLRLVTDQSIGVRFSLYSCYAWAMPLLIITVAFIVDSVSESEGYQLTFHNATCWFQHKTALLIYFAVPVFIVVVMNVVFFILSLLMILKSKSDSGSRDSYGLRSRLYLSLRLGSAMGLMWVFGIVANLTEKQWIDYLHALCTALQGVFIFFSFTFTEKTQKVCRNAIKSMKVSELSVLTQQVNLKSSQRRNIS